MTQTVSVIVVSYNTRDLLEACLHAIAQDPYPGAVETWVVDNASSDGSAQLVREQFPNVHLMANDENLGFARANNQALARASGELLFLVNSDAMVRPGCLGALAERLESNPELGVVGPALFNPGGDRQPSCGAFPTPTQEALVQTYLFKLLPLDFPVGRTVHPRLRSMYARYRTVDWLTAAALMFRRSVYARIGGLPEHTFMYGEDLEFCALAREAGFGIAYEPSAECEHHLGASARRDYRRWIASYTEATLGYYTRFGTPANRRTAAAVTLAGNLYRGVLWGALGTLQPPRRAEVAARLRGYRAAAELALSALRE